MDAEKIIDSVQLPTLSKTLIEIIEAEKADSLSFLDDIKKIVERDPLLSAHILKVSNSPMYGFSQKVRTISHAIGLLGIRKIRTMAFSFSVFDFLKKVDYNIGYGEVFNLILKKSLLISATSTILAKKTSYLNTEELYVSGLLSEIGGMILFMHEPEKYCGIYSPCDKKLIEKERQTFATDHVEVGVAFCDRFNLPGIFKAAIQFHTELQSDTEHSKIAFISNRIAELLLSEDEDEKEEIFKEIENHTKRLLHLSLSEVEETIKKLPDILDALMDDFPEMQKDLRKIVEAGSSLIINLMKKEMDMVLLTKELTVSQKKLAREKLFLSHMLNLSYFFSSLISPERVISSMFEYFDNFIHEFTIEFIYKDPVNKEYALIRNKENLQGNTFNIELYDSLVKAKISNETVQLDKHETQRMGKKPDCLTLAFPISYHHNFFGFLLLDVKKDSYLSVDMEMSYVQILTNIIANSFQNYLSFDGFKNETNKKQLVTRELIKSDKELNHSRENLIELQKAEILGELLPVIFHKLKNKLTPILGYAQILLAKVEDLKIKERLKKIERNANELTDQLNTLRDYFQTEKPTSEKDNLNRVLTRLKPYFNKIESGRNIKVMVETDRDIPDDVINAGQLETLITNIIDNSVNAISQKSAPGGAITIHTRVNGDNGGYELVIKDNGIGISQENIARIWTPFYSQFSERPGIGLTVCEKVISNHNASYSVRSKEGEFTEFKIQFNSKLKEEEDFPLTGQTAQRSDLHGKILIVDDEAYLLDLMKEILLNEGQFNVVTTTSGKEAINLMDGSFDLVISDIRMPEVSGMDLYDFMKSRKMEAKVMMVTADPYAEDVAAFLKKNNVDYLKKPFELMKFKQYVLEKLS
jgi:signal transduction histidine kinase/HD-like signal output (HDOD) protein